MQRLVGNQVVIRMLTQKHTEAPVQPAAKITTTDTSHIQRGGMTNEDAEMVGQSLGEALLWLGSTLKGLWATIGWGGSTQPDTGTSGDAPSVTPPTSSAQDESSTTPDINPVKPPDNHPSSQLSTASTDNPVNPPDSKPPVQQPVNNPPTLQSGGGTITPPSLITAAVESVGRDTLENHVKELRDIVEWAKTEKKTGLQRTANNVRIELEKLLRANKGSGSIDFTPSDWKNLKKQIDQLSLEFQQAQATGNGTGTATVVNPANYGGQVYQEVGTIKSNPKRLFVRLDRTAIQALQAGAHLTTAHLNQYETAMLKGQTESGGIGAAGIKYDNSTWVIKITISNAQSLAGADNALSPIATNPVQTDKFIYLNFDGLVYRH